MPLARYVSQYQNEIKFPLTFLGIEITPLDGFNKPKINFKKVDFPDPFGPTIPVASPPERLHEIPLII